MSLKTPLRALRGVNTIVAAAVVAKIGDTTRFENPCQLMAWLGLFPSEHSNGTTTRRGRLTKAGNALARTMLVKAGLSYRHPPKEGQPYLRRSEHLSKENKDIGVGVPPPKWSTFWDRNIPFSGGRRDGRQTREARGHRAEAATG
ncbi:transposase [Tritonibacter scottomollicae]|uniref:transposase n=1 Tax=Tritonibacter scottomollicae TaxID=483013 RepID=UPI000D07074B